MSNSLLICRHITPLSLSLQLQIVIYTFEIMFLIRNVSELSRLLMVPVLRFMFFHFNLSTNERNIISHKTLLKHFKTLRHISILSQIIIRELCSLLKLHYSIHNSIRICKRGVVAAYHVVLWSSG